MLSRDYSDLEGEIGCGGVGCGGVECRPWGCGGVDYRGVGV